MLKSDIEIHRQRADILEAKTWYEFDLDAGKQIWEIAPILINLHRYYKISGGGGPSYDNVTLPKEIYAPDVVTLDKIEAAVQFLFLDNKYFR